MKYNKINKNLLIIILLFLIIHIFYTIEFYEDYSESIKTRTIENDGFFVLHNYIYSKNTTNMPCPELKKDILNKLPNGYVFIDYVYEIKNIALSTFHRDVTSSKNIFNTEHPVYTAILYKYNGELLSVCPGSDKTYPFCWSNICNISGEKGTVFVFDCDLLHAGRINECKEREVIQYKICHKSDLNKLNHLHGVKTKKTDVCNNSYYNLFVRKLSYFFEFPINYIFYPLMIKRENSDSFIGKIQNLIPLTYYNNL
jgi:hypothetical protein